jgi:hypothetical protein
MTASPTSEAKPRRRAWPDGPDAKLLIVTGLAAIGAGLFVAIVILFATGNAEGPEEGEPITLGLASSLEEAVAEEGAIYLADPGGGSRSIWLAEEDGELVALSARVPGTADCYVDDTGETGVFEDCEGNEVLTTELNRYHLIVRTESPQDGALQVEFDRIIQAPANVET